MALEAVGLWLGVAPLIMELIKANPEPLHALKAMKKTGAYRMIDDFYRDLEFEANLVDEKSLDPMVWKRPSSEVRASLENRLNPCYDAFLHSMEKILKLVSMMINYGNTPLGLSEEHDQVYADTPYAKLEEIFDAQFLMTVRMKFAWKEEKRDKIMLGLAKYNRRIEEMLKRTRSTSTACRPPQGWSAEDAAQSVRFMSSPPYRSLREAPEDGTQGKSPECDATKSMMTNNHWFELENLCSVVRAGQTFRKASQLMLQGDTLSHSDTIIERSVQELDPGLRLEECLGEGRTGGLTMRDRKVLQVLLAQSVLLFPWMGRGLNKSSIAFHADLDIPFAIFAPDHKFGTTGVVEDSDSEWYDDITDSEIKETHWSPYDNETLATLAIILLEIELQKPVEELQTEEDLGDSKISSFESNFWATTRVLKEQQFNMYRGCYAAIDACLRCDFVDAEMTLDNPDFAQQVYGRIVAPLEEELFHGFSISIPFSPSRNTKTEKSVDGNGPSVSLTTIRVAKSAPKKSVKIFEDLHWGEPGRKGTRDISLGASAATAAPTPVVTPAAAAASAVP